MHFGSMRQKHKRRLWLLSKHESPRSPALEDQWSAGTERHRNRAWYYGFDLLTRGEAKEKPRTRRYCRLSDICTAEGIRSEGFPQEVIRTKTNPMLLGRMEREQSRRRCMWIRCSCRAGLQVVVVVIYPRNYRQCRQSMELHGMTRIAALPPKSTWQWPHTSRRDTIRMAREGQSRYRTNVGGLWENEVEVENKGNGVWNGEWKGSLCSSCASGKVTKV